MSILGTLVDQVTGSIAGSDLSNSISYATAQHSLPATNPEAVIAEITSMGTQGIINGPPALLVCGGNASVVSLGLAYGSAASCPTVAYKLTSIVFHSTVR